MSILTDIEAVIEDIQRRNYFEAAVELYTLIGEVMAALNGPAVKLAVARKTAAADLDGAMADLTALVANAKSSTAVPWASILAALLAVLQQVLPLIG